MLAGAQVGVGASEEGGFGEACAGERGEPIGEGLRVEVDEGATGAGWAGGCGGDGAGAEEVAEGGEEEGFASAAGAGDEGELAGAEG